MDLYSFLFCLLLEFLLGCASTCTLIALWYINKGSKKTQETCNSLSDTNNFPIQEMESDQTHSGIICERTG